MSKELKSLTLNVKGEYYDAAERGEKLEEYRENNEYWRSRLLNPDGTPKEFKDIQYKKGYPKAGDMTRITVYPWNGFEIKTITHKIFNDVPTEVFAIKLVAEKKESEPWCNPEMEEMLNTAYSSVDNLRQQFEGRAV